MKSRERPQFLESSEEELETQNTLSVAVVNHVLSTSILFKVRKSFVDKKAGFIFSDRSCAPWTALIEV